MSKPLKDYTGRCGSCSHFSFYVIDGVYDTEGIVNVQIPDIICTTTAGDVGTWHNIPHTGKPVRKHVRNIN